MGSGMVLPGMAVIPQKYGEAMVLYSAVNKAEAVVDGAPPGPRGRLYIVEVGKPVKMPYEAGRFILEHLGYLGVVRVRETETDSGVTYDIKGAKAESEALTIQMDEQRFQRYIDSVVEDYLKKSKPAPKTPQAIQEIMDRRGYDLRKYGIFPLGEKESEAQAKTAALEETVKQLQAQISALSKGK